MTVELVLGRLFEIEGARKTGPISDFTSANRLRPQSLTESRYMMQCMGAREVRVSRPCARPRKTSRTCVRISSVSVRMLKHYRKEPYRIRSTARHCCPHAAA
jgi:hypothetical protein